MMPRPITGEMIEAMGPVERKNLHGNALRLDTSAAKEILALIAQSELNMNVPAAKAKAPRSKAKKG